MILLVTFCVKLVVFAAIASYFIYLTNESSVTDSWMSTRKMGLAEYDYCNFQAYQDGTVVVREFNGSLPLCYLSKGISYSLCMSDDTLKSCEPMFEHLGVGSSIEAYNNMFKSTRRDYFPNSMFILLCSVIIIIISCMYESKASPVSTSVNNFTIFDRTFMIRLNVCLCFAVMLSLVFSSAQFVLTYTEDCVGLYKGEAVDRDFCSLLFIHNVVIKSVIDPPNLFVQWYRWICIVFVGCIIAAFGLMCNIKYHANTHQVHPGTDDVSIEGRVMVMTLEAKRQRDWKKISKSEVFSDSICPICLNGMCSSHSMGMQDDDVEKVFPSYEVSDVVQLLCNHYFHQDCIRQWSERHTTCPVCRLSLFNDQLPT